MALQLHLFSRTGDLLGSLLPALARARARSVPRGTALPRPVPILVPSSQLADWLQARLARDLGLSMGFEFLPPAAYFGRHLGSGDDAATLAAAHAFWSPQALRWRLLPHVDDLAHHLGHDPHKTLSPRDRFAFAELLAQQFDRYARHRPDWPARWSAHLPAWPRPPADTPASALVDEAWQRDLWHQVASQPDAPPHPAQLLATLGTRPADGADDPRSAAPLFFVGTDQLDPLTLRTFDALARQGRDIHCHLLLPSLGYLGDVNRRDAWRDRLAQADPDALPAGDGHPLLASLGRRAVGTFLLLDTVSPDYAEWPETLPDPAAPPAETPLLRRLQNDIRDQRPPAGAPADPARPDPRPRISNSDTSLRVHSCHGPRRELEVLRDELLRAFAELPGLKPEDVLVAVTDFDAYAPLAEGILRGGERPLPVRLTAVPAREANPITLALLALLRLVLGRRGASELIELLNLSAVQHRLDLADDPETLARLADAVRNSGLTHGTDATDGVGVTAAGTWRAALDRHLAGAWFGADEHACDAAGAFAHPLAADLAGADEANLAFVAWLTRLALHLKTWRDDAPAAVWAGRLERAVDDLLHSDELDDHAAALRRMLGELAAVSTPTPLDAGALLDWLQPQLDNATSLRTSLGGEILFGRLDQIHGLPCRVLALLGLQDGAFPRSSRRPAWDLLAARPEKWDTDPRTQDRQWFLDSLLAPADRLILTAANRSLRSAHDGPLSSCVEDLLRAAAATVRPATDGAALVDHLLVRHRIQPFATDYFRPDAPLPRSFNADAALIAAELRSAHANAAPRPFFDAASAPPATDTAAAERLELPLGQLVAFWKDPARAWLRALQIELPDEERDDSALDDSPLNLDGLQAYTVRAHALECHLVDGTPAASRTSDRLIADRGLPPGALGSLAWEKNERDMKDLAARVRAHLAATQPCAVRIQLAPAVTLTGDLALGRDEAAGPWMLYHRAGDVGAPKHLLDSFVQALAATVHLREPVACRLFGRDAIEGKLISAPPVAFAQQVLQALVDGYLQGRHAPLCYAPKASAAMVSAVEEGDDDGALAAASADWSSDSDYNAGEGLSPAAQIAWRDADPFDKPLRAEWLKWARAVAVPLDAWTRGSAAP